MVVTSLRVLARDPYKLLGLVDRAEDEGWTLLVITDWCRTRRGSFAPPA